MKNITNLDKNSINLNSIMQNDIFRFNTVNDLITNLLPTEKNDSFYLFDDLFTLGVVIEDECQKIFVFADEDDKTAITLKYQEDKFYSIDFDTII